jgi:mycothiol synthase
MAVELSWLSELTGDEADEVRAMLDAATEANGVPPVSEAVRLLLRPHADERTDERAGQQPGVHLLARATRAETPNTPTRNGGHAGGGARVVGYGHLAGGVGELVVHPEHRRRGVGGQLVRALLDRADAEGGTLRVWAHGEHPGAVRLAQRYGLVPVRTLWRMRRSLLEPPLDDPRWPDGVRVRPFAVGRDEAAFVEVNNKAFGWHPEQGGWDVDQVRLREAEPWFDPDGFLLAVEESTDRVLGFHWTKAHSAELGEVYVLGVDPAEHGRGLGAALTLAGLHHLRDRGMSTVMLYTEADNAPAIRTYERLGFTHWDTDVAYSSR